MKTVAVEAIVKDREILVRITDGMSQPVRYSGASMLPLTDIVGRAPHLTELFEFFLTLYTADRIVPRRKKCWTRHFRITFPVTDVPAWRAIARDLASLIWESMGDNVEFIFTHRDHRARHADFLATPLILEEPRPTTVVLLSDGLDSLCGAIDIVKRRPHDRVAFVSITTNTRKKNRIKHVRTALERLSANVSFCAANLYLSDPPRAQEQTQRSRTMLAIAAGLTVGAGYETHDVYVSENGPGILNLPVPGLQMRHHSSQVLHPANRRLWRVVAQELLGNGDITYPNRFRTKGEMCFETLRNDDATLIRRTSSCDRPDRFDQSDNCGRCGSCLVRKIALHRAGLAEHDVAYSARPYRRRRLSYEALDVLSYHAEVLGRTLASADAWPELIRLHPTLRTAFVADNDLEISHLRSETIALLRRHVHEVQFFHNGST